MTQEELNKYKRPMPLAFRDLARLSEDHEVIDDYGVYQTGFFQYKGKDILVQIENGRWHLSVSANHTLGYYELKEIRYMFLPNGIHAAQIFPPREEFVNIHPNCFHLYEIEF